MATTHQLFGKIFHLKNWSRNWWWSGHEPLFLDYIGLGMLMVLPRGISFAAPSPDNILAVTQAVDRGKGVLYVYGNYAGDVLNFDMAAELAEFEGINTKTVRVTHACGLSPKRSRTG